MDGAINFSNGNDGARAAVPERTIMELVQQRFKSDETVHMLFEAFQIKGEQEHVEGLLALVSSSSGGTYAIISFTFLRTPLTASNELKINKVYPINEKFQFIKDTKSSIMEQQFDLLSDDDRPNKYYYHPKRTDPGTVLYEQFLAKVYSCRDSMWTADLPMDKKLNFTWLDDYIEIGEVKQELKRRESQYMVYTNITVYCATWNVNNIPCWDNNSTLRPWLARGDTAPHIYAIGIQEIESTAKIMIKNVEAYRFISNQWIRKLKENLHDGDGVQYEELKTERLSGIMLTIFVQKHLPPYIVQCRSDSVARGVFKALGNKGGVAVSLKMHESYICFVNAHMAAHLPNIVDRNEDYKAIEDELKFVEHNQPIRTINDHDHIFWLGDLNYRINELPPESHIIDAQSLDSRLERDQLHTEMRAGRCFKGYTEGPIRFKPTYKYDVGTDTQDTSDKRRALAYCDRVLWKGKRIKQRAYNSVMEIRQSDHKPVYAIFDVEIKKRDETKYKRVQEEVLKAFDKLENDNQPQIVAEKIIIDFGVVRFNETSIQDFNIYNTCTQQVNFEFKVKSEDICEKWLKVDPRAGSLMIDSAFRIRLKMLADANSITGLLKKICNTRGKCDFDILILDVIAGRDIFITVTGEYQPSCFGLSIETMCRTDRPINEYKQDDIKALMLNTSSHYSVTMPREFFLLIDYLHKQGDKLTGIFQNYDRTQTLSSQFNAVRDWLDTWSEDEFPGTPQTAAEALLLLLDLPEEPLLAPVVDQLLACNVELGAMDLIEKLSPPKRNVVMHLRMFLRVGIEQQYYNLSNVAWIFGRILLRSTETEIPDDYYNRCSEFMQRFINIEKSDAFAGGNGQGQGQGQGSGGGGAIGANRQT